MAELKSRQYMTSKMAPYSANVNLILYECPKEDPQGNSGGTGTLFKKHTISSASLS